MDDSQKVNFNVDPVKTPVYYVDSYVIGSSEHALTINFAQASLVPGQQQIVSRVALTKDQAKDMVKNLQDHIEKFEL